MVFLNLVNLNMNFEVEVLSYGVTNSLFKPTDLMCYFIIINIYLIIFL